MMEADQDGDGKLSFEEFKDMVASTDIAKQMVSSPHKSLLFTLGSRTEQFYSPMVPSAQRIFGRLWKVSQTKKKKPFSFD